MKEEYSRTPSPRLLKDIQEAKKHIPQLQGQLCKAMGSGAAQVTTHLNATSIQHELDLPSTSLEDKNCCVRDWIGVRGAEKPFSSRRCTDTLDPV